MKPNVTDLLAPYSDSELMQLQVILLELDPKSMLLKLIDQELDLRCYYTTEELQ